MAMQNYTPMRLAPNLDSGLRNDLLKVDRFLRQLTPFAARVPSAPQGTPSSSGSFDLTNFLYLPGRAAGQRSLGRVQFETKFVAAGASVTPASQQGFGWQTSSTSDGPTQVNLSIEGAATSRPKTPEREWVFPAFNQLTQGVTVGAHFFVDESDYQVLTKKTVNTFVHELDDIGGTGFLHDISGVRASTGVGVPTFNVLINGSFPTTTWPRTATGPTDGIQPIFYIPPLDNSGAATSGGNSALRDKSHIFPIMKSASPTAATPFEDAGFLYGGGSRREVYQMPGRAMGTLSAPTAGSIPMWLPSISTTGTFTVSTNTVTAIPSTTGMSAGQRIRMTAAAHITQLGEDVYIKSVDSGTQITLSVTYSGATLAAEPFIVFGPVWSSSGGAGVLSDYLYLPGRTGGQFIGTGTMPTGGGVGDVSIQTSLSIGRSGSALTGTSALDSFIGLSAVSSSGFAHILQLDQSASGAASGSYSVLNLVVPNTFGVNFSSGGYNLSLINAAMTPVLAVGTAGNTLQGILFSLAPSGTGGFTAIFGVDLQAFGSSGAAVGSSLIGFKSGVHPVASALTNVIGVQAAGLSGSYSGTTTQATAFDVGSTFMNSTTVTTWSGLRISTGLTAAIANKWSLDLTNTSTNMGSRIAHKTAIGWNPSTVAAITARMMLAVGTTAASTAPLKFQSGTSMTAAEAGAVEFTTDDLFFTITTGAARKAFVLDDGTRLTAGRVPFATTNGRLTDDADMTFATDTLTITKIAATQLTGNLTFADTINIITNGTTGSKIGTATTQKIGFWNTAPIVQPTAVGAAATFVANTSGIVDDSATFDGYTLGQVVKALRNIGLLA